MKLAEFRPYCACCPFCSEQEDTGKLICRLHLGEIGNADRCTLHKANIKRQQIAVGLNYHQMWRKDYKQAQRAVPPYVMTVIIDAAIEKLTE